MELSGPLFLLLRFCFSTAHHPLPGCAVVPLHTTPTRLESLLGSSGIYGRNCFVHTPHTYAHYRQQFREMQPKKDLANNSAGYRQARNEKERGREEEEEEEEKDKCRALARFPLVSGRR